MLFLLIRPVLLAALRDRLLLALPLFMAAAAAMASFISYASLTEQQEMRAAVAGGSVRLIVVAGLVLFVVFHVRRSFDSREVEMLLSRPISRSTYVLACMAAFGALALLMALVAVAVVAMVAAPSPLGLALWGVSLVMELWVMAAAALFFSLSLPTATVSALVCGGFYVLARMIGVVLGAAHMGDPMRILHLADRIMDYVAVVVPRLDLFGQSSWLVYGYHGGAGEAPLWLLVVHGVGYVTLLVAAAVVDLRRREF
ncbi:MAG: hypothetical protein WCK65_05985 [Rhodospirillaceae bacterium]